MSLFKLGPGEKELVIGVEADGQIKAYPLELVRNSGTVADAFAGQTLTLCFDPHTDLLTLRDSFGTGLERYDRLLVCMERDLAGNLSLLKLQPIQHIFIQNRSFGFR